THLNIVGPSSAGSYRSTPTAGVTNYGASAPGGVGNGPSSSGPTYTTTAAAKDSNGNWNPGIYKGVYPSGGKMNPGVYKIINVSQNINLGTITNTIAAPSGVLDSSGAVAIVLDATDTGDLNISTATLNGVDDLGTSGTRDP